MDVLDHLIPAPVPATAPAVRPDERAARRTLRAQIAKLESELAAAFATAYPQGEIDWSVGAPGGPRLLSIGDLERVRDALAVRLATAGAAIDERAGRQAEKRLLIEQMLLRPERHKWLRVSNADIGEPGCKHWHVRPRLGLIGMLMGWWRVKISSGCPLPEGRRLRRRPASRSGPAR